MADHLIAGSPAAELKIKKAKKRIRETPTFEEFQAIVTDLRAQAYDAEATDSGDFVEFMGLAGLGKADSTTLILGDVDWQNKRITACPQKTIRGFAALLYPQLKPLPELHVFGAIPNLQGETKTR